MTAPDHPKMLDLSNRLVWWRYPDEEYMDLAAMPVLPACARTARLKRNEWQELKSIVHDVSGYTCRYCMRNVESFAICDHIVPLSRGGDNSFENLATACADCNSSKGILTPQEFDRKRCAHG